MGRILQERRTIGAVTGDYETDAFNLAGLPASITSLGYSVTYTYGGAGRALSAINHTGSTSYQYVIGAAYAPPGELTAATLGATSSFAGIVTNNAYNDRLQPILLSAAVTGQSPVFSDCFDFHLGVAVSTSPCSFSANSSGDNGNVYQIVNNRNTARSDLFMYDSLNRIQQAYSSGSGSLSWGETFGTTATSPGVAPSTPGIDSWGNLSNRSGVTGKTFFENLSCPANTKNQLTTCSYGYDAAGNMTSNGTVSYVYDAENRLIAVSGDSTPTSYIYDGDGQRVEKCSEGSTPGACATGGTGTLYWRGTSSDALSETNLSGTVQNTYVFFNGKRVARLDGAGAVHYYFSDHLGTHGVVENATATTCEQDIDYYPYGGQENDYCSGTSVPQNYKFTGKERDGESGLDDFGARYNASTMGRWISPDLPFADQDPENPQSWNLYGYVRNNPLNSIDTNGRVTWLIGGTWHKSNDWTPSSPLGREMAGFFDSNDDDVEPIPWSGGNSAAARAELAANIVSAMKNHPWKPGEQNNIVCHSHGCNGVEAALRTLVTDGYFIDNLVSLGMPMRGDYRYTGGVEVWWNVYAPNDLIQKLGGRIPLFGGRTNPNAFNIRVNTGRGLFGAHGALHSDWATRMQWEMFLGSTQDSDGSKEKSDPSSDPSSDGPCPAYGHPDKRCHLARPCEIRIMGIVAMR